MVFYEMFVSRFASMMVYLAVSTVAAWFMCIVCTTLVGLLDPLPGAVAWPLIYMRLLDSSYLVPEPFMLEFA